MPNIVKCPFWWNPSPAVNVLYSELPQIDDSSVLVLASSSSWIEKYYIIAKLEYCFDINPTNQIRGLGMVATRDIEPGEELFVNYRYFSGHDNIPSWYHPVDVEENIARWS